jgi:hypothetical protein
MPLTFYSHSSSLHYISTQAYSDFKYLFHLSQGLPVSSRPFWYCRIWGSDSGGYESYLLGYNELWAKKETTMKTIAMPAPCLFLCSLFDREDGSDVSRKRRLAFNRLYGVISQKIGLCFDTVSPVILTKLFTTFLYFSLFNSVKGKVIPVPGRGGPYGCETLRVPQYLDNRITDGSKVVSLMPRPPFTAQEGFWYSFLLEAESIPGP